MGVHTCPPPHRGRPSSSPGAGCTLPRLHAPAVHKLSPRTPARRRLVCSPSARAPGAAELYVRCEVYMKLFIRDPRARDRVRESVSLWLVPSPPCPGRAGRGQGCLPTHPEPEPPHLQPSGVGSQAPRVLFFKCRNKLLTNDRRLSALHPSFPSPLRIRSPLLGRGLLPSSIRKYFCSPLLLGAVVAGRAPNGLPGPQSGSPLPGFSLPISTEGSPRLPPPPSSPLGSGCSSQSWGRVGVSTRLALPRLGCGTLAEPAHLATTRVPAAGHRPAVRGADRWAPSCCPHQPPRPLAQPRSSSRRSRVPGPRRTRPRLRWGPGFTSVTLHSCICLIPR